MQLLDKNSQENSPVENNLIQDSECILFLLRIYQLQISVHIMQI